MFTLSGLDGKWRFGSILGFGSEAFSLYSGTLRWVVIRPDGGSRSVSSFRGSINESHLNRFGDRDCTHYDAYGALVRTDEKFTVGSGTFGRKTDFPQKVYQTITVKATDGTYTFPCILQYALAGWRINCEDHKSTSSKWFKNCFFEGIVDSPTTVHIHYHYEASYDGGQTWYISDLNTPLAEVDFPNFRYRSLPSTIWTSFSTFTSQGVSSNPSSEKFSTRQWQRLVTNLELRAVNLNSDEFIFGDLCRRCANDAQILDINNIENLSDLRNLTEEMKRLLSLLRGKPSLKMVSSLYLSYKYGVRLTVSDCIEMYKSLPRAVEQYSRKFSWVRSVESIQTPSSSPLFSSRLDTYHYKIYYDNVDTGMRKFLNHWWNTGLFPSLKNSWDLIPLSFVVDWFINVSDALSQYDASTYWSTCLVEGAIASKKSQFQGVASELVFPGISRCAGSLTVKKYVRTSHPILVKPTFYTDTPREFRNYAESTALIISRKRN